MLLGGGTEENDGQTLTTFVDNQLPSQNKDVTELDSATEVDRASPSQ